MSLPRLVARLRAEHRHIERYIDLLRRAADHPEGDWLHRIEAALHSLAKIGPRHYALEERFLFPLAPWLESRLLEHHRHAAELEAYLAQLLPRERAQPTDRIRHDLIRAAQELHDVIQIHIIEEERHLLTR